MDCLTLSPVTLDSAGFLYDLLKERPPEANISHRKMPTFEEHVEFVRSGGQHPVYAWSKYDAWYVVLRSFPIQQDLAVHPIGSVYLTNQNEIGIFLTKEFQGKKYGDRVLDMLMATEPRKAYLANIAPGNIASQKFFQRRGFTHIQNTFELRVE